MSKVYECDVCKKTIKLDYTQKYPEDWFMVKILWKAQSKGGESKGYHLCKRCKEKIFGNVKK